MVGENGWGATEQWDCRHGAISYGDFSNPERARSGLVGAYNYVLSDEADDREKACDQAVKAHMTAVKRAAGQWKGTTRCSVGVVDGVNAGDLSIYWNNRGSRVDGLLYVGKETKPHDSVEYWAKLISAR